MPSSILAQLYYFFETEVSHYTCAHTWTRLASGFRDQLSRIFNLGSQAHVVLHLALYMGASDLSSGLHAWAGTLPAEPSPFVVLNFHFTLINLV